MMKNQMSKVSLFRTSALLTAVTAMFSAHSVMAQASSQAQKDAENFWYAQGSLGVLKDSHSALATKLSDFVQVSGTAFYDQGRTGSIVVGRQMFNEEKWNLDHPARLELEAWHGSAKRQNVRLGVLTAAPNDMVKAKALMLNFMGRLTDSEEKAQNLLPLWRTWFGFGFGYGSISYPGATLSNCNCLRAGESDGEMAVQAKLAVERQLGRDTMLVAQAARIWLPGASFGSGGYPQTQYGDWGVTTYSVGLRVGFR